MTDLTAEELKAWFKDLEHIYRHRGGWTAKDQQAYTQLVKLIEDSDKHTDKPCIHNAPYTKADMERDEMYEEER